MIEITNFDDDDPPIFALRATGSDSVSALDEWLNEELPKFTADKLEAAVVHVLLEPGAALSNDEAEDLAQRHDVDISVHVEGTQAATLTSEA